jgi:hypothetical protein
MGRGLPGFLIVISCHATGMSITRPVVKFSDLNEMSGTDPKVPGCARSAPFPDFVQIESGS